MSLIAKFIITVTVVLVAGLVASVEPAGPADCSFKSDSYDGLRERYIVFLNPTSTTDHLQWLKSCLNRQPQKLANTDFSATTINKDLVIDFSVDGHAYGYTAWFDAKFVEEQLSKRPEAVIVEKDAPVKLNAALPPRTPHNDTTQKNPNPNLDRIDQAKFPLNHKYTYPASAGSGATVYVVDTGVLVSHNEFEGRATFGAAICAGCPKADDNGHGSHVSGIIAGKTFGVAKKANIIGVKVLDSGGAGTIGDVINGLMFVLGDHKKKNNSAIVNMSLGGPFSTAINKAVESLTQGGIHTAVAAGNDGIDACTESPSSEPSAITVGATEDTSDNIVFFSNIGKCVDIFAPGVNILSVGIGSNSDTAVLSGTSQATPHVVGTLALIIGEKGNLTPKKMAIALDKLATKGVIPNASGGSPNTFLRVPQ